MVYQVVELFPSSCQPVKHWQGPGGRDGQVTIAIRCSAAFPGEAIHVETKEVQDWRPLIYDTPHLPCKPPKYPCVSHLHEQPETAGLQCNARTLGCHVLEPPLRPENRNNTPKYVKKWNESRPSIVKTVTMPNAPTGPVRPWGLVAGLPILRFLVHLRRHMLLVGISLCRLRWSDARHLLETWFSYAVKNCQGLSKKKLRNTLFYCCMY
jgi:hypothetical protein